MQPQQILERVAVLSDRQSADGTVFFRRTPRRFQQHPVNPLLQLPASPFGEGRFIFRRHRAGANLLMDTPEQPQVTLRRLTCQLVQPYTGFCFVSVVTAQTVRPQKRLNVCGKHVVCRQELPRADYRCGDHAGRQQELLQEFERSQRALNWPRES
jgi:hypothetical protein